MSLQTWGQIRLNSKSKVPRWDDFPVSWLQAEPLLVSYEAGGAPATWREPGHSSLGPVEWWQSWRRTTLGSVAVWFCFSL